MAGLHSIRVFPLLSLPHHANHSRVSANSNRLNGSDFSFNGGARFSQVRQPHSGAGAEGEKDEGGFEGEGEGGRLDVREVAAMFRKEI